MYLDWIAFIIGIIGAYYVARKCKYCWILLALSNIIWIIYSILTKQLALGLECFGFLVVNIYGWIKWQEEYNQCRKKSILK